MDDKFYRIADAVAGDLEWAQDIYVLLVEAAQRGYNLRAIEELEGE